MAKKIIQIDEEKCVGCGLCANACKQSAIEIIDGKAKVVRDDYCDGLGNCLPVCPVGAISFSDKDVINKGNKLDNKKGGCPGAMAKSINHKVVNNDITENVVSISQLKQWPIQIKLAPVDAPYFDNANLLIAADCSAYAYGDFHNKFMKNKVTLIGCPKLDQVDYSNKLTEIITNNDIKSITVVRMEVPCCGGLEFAVKNAIKNALINSDKMVPWQVVTISTDGKILD